jgi:MOSC domain-containing protein YiiM
VTSLALLTRPPWPVGTVVGLFIAPDRGRPMEALDRVDALAGRGLRGDRYARGQGTYSRWPGAGRHVTLIEQETLDSLADEVGITLAGSQTRRNIVTRATALGELVGHRFWVGNVAMLGVRPADPCALLERNGPAGVRRALAGRGGLRADITRGGTMHLGDPIRLDDQERWATGPSPLAGSPSPAAPSPASSPPK